jgi:hypothetical protein
MGPGGAARARAQERRLVARRLHALPLPGERARPAAGGGARLRRRFRARARSSSSKQRPEASACRSLGTSRPTCCVTSARASLGTSWCPTTRSSGACTRARSPPRGASASCPDRASTRSCAAPSGCLARSSVTTRASSIRASASQSSFAPSPSALAHRDQPRARGATPRRRLGLRRWRTHALRRGGLFAPTRRARERRARPYARFAEARSRLRKTSLYYLDLALNTPAEQPWHWCYVPDPSLPFYRVGCYSNFSGAMAPVGKASLYVELARAKSPIWARYCPPWPTSSCA